MPSHKRDQNNKKQDKTSYEHVTETMADNNNFVDAYFTTTPIVDQKSKLRQYNRDHHLSYFSDPKDTTRRITSNSSLSHSSLRGENTSIVVNSNIHVRPNTSIINSPSSIAELVMKGEIDNPLVRVTTARPTIIIYPTGK